MTEQPHISIDPAIQYGDPCVADTRLEAKLVAAIWWANARTLEDILGDYPGLTRKGVIVACWFMARHGTPTWRKRWKAWHGRYNWDLWGRNYSVPLPPRKGEA